MTKKSGENRIPSLDGLRAFAIALVVAEHTATHSALGEVARQWAPAWILFGSGFIAVQIFFVISGYLITNMLIRELDASGDIKLTRFYERRAFRILPAFYTYLGIVLLLGALGVMAIERRDVIIAGTFLWNYVPSTSPWPKPWWFGQYWTLSIEEQFYLFWPATLLLLGRRRATKLALALIVVTPFIRVGSYLAFPALRGRLGMMLHVQFDTLMFGSALALLSGDALFERLYERAKRLRLPAVGALYCLLVAPVLAKELHGYYTITFGETIQGIAIALTTCWLMREPKTAAGRILNSRVFVHVGVISYSIYLYQQLFSGPVTVLPIHSVPLQLLATTVCAELSYWLVEHSFLRIRSRVARREAPRPTLQSTPVESSTQVAVEGG